MKGYISAQEAAEREGYEYTYYTRLLKAGEVAGARKWQGLWMVPEDAHREKMPPGRKKATAKV